LVTRGFHGVQIGRTTKLAEEATIEPGFLFLGPNEAAAISMAVLIIVDWALFRYGR